MRLPFCFLLPPPLAPSYAAVAVPLATSPAHVGLEKEVCSFFIPSPCKKIAFVHASPRLSLILPKVVSQNSAVADVRVV